MNKDCWIFCVSALLASLAVAVVAIPFASISEARLAKAKSVVAAEELGTLDLKGFGEVSVEEMASYYVENPPVQTSQKAARVRFEGC